jgi:hypothetical protein
MCFSLFGFKTKTQKIQSEPQKIQSEPQKISFERDKMNLYVSDDIKRRSTDIDIVMNTAQYNLFLNECKTKCYTGTLKVCTSKNNGKYVSEDTIIFLNGEITSTTNDITYWIDHFGLHFF